VVVIAGIPNAGAVAVPKLKPDTFHTQIKHHAINSGTINS